MKADHIIEALTGDSGWGGHDSAGGQLGLSCTVGAISV